MTRPVLNLSLAGFGGLIAGIGIGYIVAEKRLSRQFEIRLEKETAGMREFYQVVKKPYATPQEAAKALIEDEPVESDGESTAAVIGDKIAYHKIVKKEYKPLVDPEEELAMVGSRPPDEIKHHNLFVAQPMVISQEEFLQNDTDYVQSTLTYYEGDGVLTDERESVIEDIDETVGLKNMTKFGTNASDPNVVHIRNGRLQMEFEVCRDENSYSKIVLGMDADPPQLPSGRKRP
jgi:hypothetical protein